MNKRKLLNYLNGFGRFCILAFFFIIAVAPLYWMVISAFKSNAEFVNVKITYFPKKWTFENFESLFSQLKFGTYLYNSILLSVTSAAVVTIFSILGGYAISYYEFRGKKEFMFFFLLSQMIPGVLIMIPMYIFYSKVGLLETHFGLFLLYIAANAPFCAITMSGFFQNIPRSLEEAARVDGCNKLQSLIKVIIPILFNGIVAVFVFAFTGAWNNLLFGIIFTSVQSMWTIPVGMKSLIGKSNVKWGELMAGGVLATVPTIIMFAFVQKYVVEGLTAGSVKG